MQPNREINPKNRETKSTIRELYRPKRERSILLRSEQLQRPLRVWLIAAGVALVLCRHSFDGTDRFGQNAILDGALIYPLPD
jgi:hypothetical protein